MTRKERDQAEKSIELTTYNQTVRTFNHNCGVAAVRGTFYERYKRAGVANLTRKAPAILFRYYPGMEHYLSCCRAF